MPSSVILVAERRATAGTYPSCVSAQLVLRTQARRKEKGPHPWLCEPSPLPLHQVVELRATARVPTPHHSSPALTMIRRDFASSILYYVKRISKNSGGRSVTSKGVRPLRSRAR